MKTTILLLMIFCSCNLLAQEDTLGRSKYKCKVNLLSNEEVVGDLYKLGDSSIVIKEEVIDGLSYSRISFELMPLQVSAIDNIIVKKKGALAKGIIIGGLSGFLIGGLLGYAAGGEEESVDGQWNIMIYTQWESAILGGIVGFIPGAIIGAVAGSNKITINLHGKKERYDKWKEDMKSYLVVH